MWATTLTRLRMRVNWTALSVTGCTFVDADLRVPPILLLNFLKSWFNASKSGFECTVCVTWNRSKSKPSVAQFWPPHLQSSIARQWRTFRLREKKGSTSLMLTLEKYSDLPKRHGHSEKLPRLWSALRMRSKIFSRRTFSKPSKDATHGENTHERHPNEKTDTFYVP